MSFTDSTAVALLTPNLFKRDFKSKSQYEAGLAISTLSSICTAEVARDLITDLQSMLTSSRAYLRKKTVLCMYRVFLKDPPALRTCFPKLKERLGDEDQGVLTATVNTFLELARKNARNYLSLVPQLYHILVNTANNWLTIKLLKLFQLLCPLEPRLPSKMVEPLTNLLNTTKAQSVEFEVIRTAIRGTSEEPTLTSQAIEKLQALLNSSDRNLRFIALEMFKEMLDKPHLKEKCSLPVVHEKVLICIAESDTTARKVALLLLDRIVTPESFVDTVKKLMEFSKNTAAPTDEFVGTILRMGGRDRYALVEDFAWYLLVLADISRSLDSAHSSQTCLQVAEQFTDIAARVPQVRPYATTLALGLVDRTTPADQTPPGGDAEQGAAKDAGALDVAVPMIGACAWTLGEYFDAFEGPLEATFLRAARALLVPKAIQALEPTIQSQCVWATAKLYMGSATVAPGACAELHELLVAHLPAFIKSTHVDVSERATLAMNLASFFKADVGKMAAGVVLFQEPLLPVSAGAQQAVPAREELLLDEPFFAPEEAPHSTFAPVKADPTDPYALAATYKDDLGFMAAQEAKQSAVSPSQSEQKSSLFYLGAGRSPLSEQGGAAAGDGAAAEDAAKVAAPAAATDPLEQMRERLAASRAGGATAKYEVYREDIKAPSAPSGGPAAQKAPPPAAGAATGLPVPPEKELGELQGRLWSQCFRDGHVAVYFCVRQKSFKKQQLRVEMRCERVGSVPGSAVSAVTVALPSGLSAQEADGAGVVVLVPGELVERSAKVKLNLGLAPFLAPAACPLQLQLQYMLAADGSAASTETGSLELPLPATTFLEPAAMTEDAVAEYIGQHAATMLSQQAAQAVNLNAPGKSAEALADELPGLVGTAAGLCHFHGIRGAASGASKGQKFLLVANPPAQQAQSPLQGQVALPAGARVVCMCAALGKEGLLELKVTVKSCRKDVCDDICSQLLSIFRELVEGRLKPA
ncbi:unnamed protein product [Prorocentrum cordatum]|uniref:Clathrin/coatomer adaptor adaptin-like N-terminal domain-containing protein n=1 Tax=Prorocentrum cordatum TaxID=2364126 RepID=A0ABN9VIH3_9DINO|nr:unnamed protein product [Polarella glacialis]